MRFAVSGPLSALTLAAISVACLLTGEFNRRGQTKRVLLAVGLAFVVEVIDVALKDLSARSWIAIPLLYSNLLVPLLVALWMLWRESAPSWRRRSLAAQLAIGRVQLEGAEAVAGTGHVRHANHNGMGH